LETTKGSNKPAQIADVALHYASEFEVVCQVGKKSELQLQISIISTSGCENLNSQQKITSVKTASLRCCEK
jgi:hypothetical protein